MASWDGLGAHWERKGYEHECPPPCTKKKFQLQKSKTNQMSQSYCSLLNNYLYKSHEVIFTLIFSGNINIGSLPRQSPTVKKKILLFFHGVTYTLYFHLTDLKKKVLSKLLVVVSYPDICTLKIRKLCVSVS